MPHEIEGILRNSSKPFSIEKPQLRAVVYGVEQVVKELRPGSPTTNLISGLHSKSEKLVVSMHIYTFRFDKRKRKRNKCEPSKSKAK